MVETKPILADIRDLRPILEPKSIAVIGASRQHGTIGHAVLANLIASAFTGEIYPINPNARSILYIPAYPTVLDIPELVDLAVIIVRAQLVPEVLEQCGQKGIKGAVVITAGFRERGEEGAKLEAQVKEVAQRYNISLVGPNCLGVINTDPAIKLNATFAKGMPPKGNIGVVSQSGALCVAILDYAKGQGFGLSKVISLGNKADVNENDSLAYLWHDPQTQVILLYLEDLTNGRQFLELATEITGGEEGYRKPILALKAGRTPASSRAIASHTGALAGSDEVYDAIFTQAGVLRVDTVEDLFEYAIAFAYQPLPKGRKTVIVSNAGGAAIMAADACVRYGLDVIELSSETTKRLGEKLPPHVSIQNPIDLIGDAQYDRFEVTLDAMLDDPNIDGIIVLSAPHAVLGIEEIAQAIVRASQRKVKPILACFMGIVDVSAAVRILEENRVPCYSFPEDAARALAAMVRYVDWVKRPRTGIKTFHIDSERARKLLTEATPSEHGFIPEDIAMQVLEAYGLPVLPWAVAKTADEAIAAAHRIGFPVALKVISPDVVHKFDVGGVQLNLQSDGDVRHAFQRIIHSVKEHHPNARIDGILVQQMVERGREVILGLKTDPQFGPILMFGLGGIYVEILRDVTFRLAPVRELEAVQMIQGIRTYKFLEGVRGEPPADVDAIVECIERLSQMAVEQDAIDELDINPLIVYAKGKGAFVADVRIAVES